MLLSQLAADGVRELLDPAAIDANDVDALVTAARNGDPRAQFDLAELLRTEPQDPPGQPWDLIISLCAQAAHAGLDEARLRLGWIVDDSQAAADWVRPLAEAGNPEAMRVMGLVARQNGDTHSAAAWLRAAGEAGEEQAWNDLSDIYMHYDDQDREAAIAAFQRALGVKGSRAWLGLLRAAAELAEEGNIRRAYDLYVHLTDHGEYDAAMRLAELYQPATSYPKEVLYWLRRAHDLSRIAPDPARQAAELHERLGDPEGAAWWRLQVAAKEAEKPAPPPSYNDPIFQQSRKHERARNPPGKRG